MDAFVPTSTFTPRAISTSKTFHGAKPPLHHRTTPTAAKWRMAKYDLDKYAAMSADGPAGQPPPPPTTSPGASSWWTMYRDSLKAKYTPFRAPKDPEVAAARNYSNNAILAGSTSYFRIQAAIDGKFFGQGGDPEIGGQFGGVLDRIGGVADGYMADCVKRAYMAIGAVGYGVYDLSCTEGVVKGQAEDSRKMALEREFRMKQRSASQKYGDFYEQRRMAINACEGCTYEEGLVLKFPKVAKSMVRGFAEAKSVCVRYAEGTSKEEEYMKSSVDMQMKARAVPMGVYDIGCIDGTTQEMAQYKRVAALYTKFRAKQYSTSQKERAKYDAAKYARDNFGHECGYEEAYFNNYKAVASAMRPSTDRY